jgi:DNA-binding NarL/FixJ family response regulator
VVEVSVVATIRAVLIGMSPLLRDIVEQSISTQMDVEIIDEIFADDWGERLRSLSPDVVIISLGRNESDDIMIRLLEIVPNARIVTLSHDSRQAIFCEMHTRPTVFPDFSPEEIVSLISRAHGKAG